MYFKKVPSLSLNKNVLYIISIVFQLLLDTKLSLQISKERTKWRNCRPPKIQTNNLVRPFWQSAASQIPVNAIFISCKENSPKLTHYITLRVHNIISSLQFLNFVLPCPLLIPKDRGTAKMIHHRLCGSLIQLKTQLKKLEF